MIFNFPSKCLCGAGGVGAKSALVTKFIQNVFKTDYDLTIGILNNNTYVHTNTQTHIHSLSHTHNTRNTTENSYMKSADIDDLQCILDILDIGI